MKEITMFIQRGCPHCILAKSILKKMLSESEKYGELVINEVDENQQQELAASYDYWYVPSFFIGSEKLHEGHAEYEDVKRVLDAALAS